MTQKSLMPYWVLPAVALILSSCSVRQEDISGVYTIKGSKNTLDTLKIASNGTYIRTLYARNDQRLLFKNKDDWKFDGSSIQLYNYLPDEDEDYGPEAVLGLGTILCYLPVKNHFDGIVIEAPRLGDNALYEKL